MQSIRELVDEYRTIIIPASLFIITVGVFFGILTNGFVYDDDFGISYNTPLLKSVDPVPLFQDNTYLFNSRNAPGAYRPLSVWITAITIRFFGIEPFFFHAISLILHGINVVLAYYFINLLTGKRLPAYFVALLWGIHPVQVEAVAWAFQQSTLWAMMFGFLSLIIYLLYLGRQKRWLLGTSLILTMIAILCKDQAIMIPFFVLGINIYKNIDWRENIYLALTFFSLGVVFLLMRITLDVSFDQTPGDLSRFTLFLIMIKGFAYYILLMFWPNPLTVDYDQFLKIAPSFFWASTLLIYTAALFFVALRTNKTIAFGIFWFFVGLAPVSNVIFPMIQFLNERFLYIPSLGFVVAIVFTGVIVFEKVFEIIPKIRLATVGIITLVPLLVLSTTSIDRVKDWKNNESLWRSAYEVNPLSLRTQGAYASSLYGSGKIKESFREYLILIDSMDIETWASILSATLSLAIDINDIETGNKVAANTLKRYPENASLHRAVGKFYVQSNQIQKAETFWIEYINKFSVNELAIFYLIFTKHRLGKDSEIETYLTQLYRKDLLIRIPSLFRGYDLYASGNYKEAISLLEASLHYQQDISVDEPYVWLAESYEKIGNKDLALVTYYHLMRINSGSSRYEPIVKRLLQN